MPNMLPVGERISQSPFSEAPGQFWSAYKDFVTLATNKAANGIAHKDRSQRKSARGASQSESRDVCTTGRRAVAVTASRQTRRRPDMVAALASNTASTRIAAEPIKPLQVTGCGGGKRQNRAVTTTAANNPPAGAIHLDSELGPEAPARLRVSMEEPHFVREGTSLHSLRGRGWAKISRESRVLDVMIGHLGRSWFPPSRPRL
jgi:hypothetical protein